MPNARAPVMHAAQPRLVTQFIARLAPLHHHHHQTEASSACFASSGKKGRSWLKYINDLMYCAACRLYPQPGGSPELAQGTNKFRALAVKKHERFGLHPVALDMWVSNGRKSSALRTLPPHVHDGVPTTFRAVYQGKKSGGSLRDFPGDLSMIELSGDNVLPGYRSRFSARGILADVAVPFRNTEGTIIPSAEFSQKITVTI